MLGIIDTIFVGMFAMFGLVGLVYRAKAWSKVRGWKVIGVMSFIAYFFVAGYSPMLWDNYLGNYTLFNASELPLEAAIPVGFIMLQLGIYVWHRTIHNVQGLWRWFHQMHHSAERMDIFGAFYFHPLDILGFTLVGSVMLVAVFGLSGEAAGIVNIMAAFCSMFQHANINTPRWLGYIVTRPESHSIHHERGHHAQNYGDIPLWDMVFGTFKNANSWADEVGLYDGSTLQIGDLLMGRDLMKECPRPVPRRPAVT